MKHLKLFENKGDKFWIVTYEQLEDANSNDQQLFDDRESAENYYIELMNDLKKSDMWYKNYEEMPTDELILTVQEADDWINDNYDKYRVLCKQIINKGQYELPEEIRLAREAKKYNL